MRCASSGSGTLTRSARPFAVRFDEARADQLLALKDLLGQARLATTLVYLRRRNKQLAMECVRDLSWGSVDGFVLQPNAVEADAGLEPALPSSVTTTKTTA